MPFPTLNTRNPWQTIEDRVQFLDDAPADHHSGFTIFVDLKEHFSFTQLLVRTAQQTHQLVLRAAQDDVGEGAVLGPRATALAWSGGRPHCAGLARGRERGGPRERGCHAPGQPSDPDRHAGLLGGVPVSWLLFETVVVHS